MFDRLCFSTSGFPNAAPKKNPIEALQVVKDLGLDGMELEFAHGVRIRDDVARQLAKKSKDLGLILSAHAPYYINLNAKEQDKIDASINRLLQTARLAGMCGAFSMTFHAAFYMKDDPRSVFDIVRRYLSYIIERLRDEGNQIHLRPELTGRKSQFGTMEELCELSQMVPNVYPCLDFSHSVNRTDGKGNSYKDFAEIFDQYRINLGKSSLQQMHIHVAGVQYGAKGEIHHLTLKESGFNYLDFLKACKDFDLKGCIVCESPQREEDTLLLKSTFEKLTAVPRPTPGVKLDIAVVSEPETHAPVVPSGVKTPDVVVAKTSQKKGSKSIKGSSGKATKSAES